MAWPASLSNEQVLDTVASYTSDAAISPRNSSRRQTGTIASSPSADPELWAAIAASLEDQGKRQQRQLSRHLSDVAPEVAGRLREQRRQQLRCSPEGVTYFCWEGEAGSGSSCGSEAGSGSSCGSEAGGCASPCGGAGDAQGPAAAAGTTAAAAVQDCGLVLPSMAAYPPAVREAVLGQLQNEYLQNEAEAEGVINTVPGCTPQIVLSTLGDGNCLSHSCSLGVWGVHDKDARLRSAIHATMAHPLAGQQIRVRFERQLAASGIPPDAWPAEWERELSSFRTSSSYLSDVHAFVLANVLRRPLLVYGDQQAAEAALAGIYLPSLWPRPQEQCSRQPLSILYGWSHFSLLATVQGEGPASPPLLPLCMRDGPLQLRFLSAEQEAQLAAPSNGASSGGSNGGTGSSGAGSGGSGSTERQLALLRRFMDAERLFNGRLGVRLSETPRPHVLVSLLGSLFLRQAAEMVAEEEQQQQQQQAAVDKA
ncbi:hypothetical protein ABPG75_004080 [Micractinium tetrahymenae]